VVNRILSVEIHDHSLAPATAEVRITVKVEKWTPTTEVRGRLMGPHCLYASTVEIAYPLRPLNSPSPSAAPVFRVPIPEASLWDPQSPFLYEGPIELWQDGQHCDRTTVRHGLCAINLGTGGLRVNGRPLTLMGRRLAECSPEEARALRQAGYNLLVVPASPGSAALGELADRLGFFVLAEVSDDTDEVLACLGTLASHPSCLGWLVRAGCGFLPRLPPGHLVGVRLEKTSPLEIPKGASFVLASPDWLGSGGMRLPVLVAGPISVESHRSGPGVLGSVL
jgi:hypothetical protein